MIPKKSDVELMQEILSQYQEESENAHKQRLRRMGEEHTRRMENIARAHETNLGEVRRIQKERSIFQNVIWYSFGFITAMIIIGLVELFK